MPSVCLRTLNICGADDAGKRRSLSPIEHAPPAEAANTRHFRNDESAEVSAGLSWTVRASALGPKQPRRWRGRLRRLCEVGFRV
jgi:hypothetical protein